jgi:hypothetical protein
VEMFFCINCLAVDHMFKISMKSDKVIKRMRKVVLVQTPAFYLNALTAMRLRSLNRINIRK